MTDINDPERERIVVQALCAQTVAEIEVAGSELRQWIANHPDDLSAEDALEPLALRRRGLQSQQVEPIAVGQASA